ncbi:MAG TPA: squalene/phytoene synthase family protein [Candidatus Udaeobacter sp.]|nr:squalene/phytoene synthase family protein [Candidatus Udaeobacter sp.]
MDHDLVAVRNLQYRHHRCRLQIMSLRSNRSLQTTLLRSVSRSFYLSIRCLPARLREPVALAYLLARATDSVADTTGIANTVRIETLKMLSHAIQGKASREVVVDLIASFVPLQNNASEQRLLESVPDCLAWLDTMERADRNDVRVVLEKITAGQRLDLERFDNAQEIRALATAAELDEYTYLVAGCVGEFWTRLCFRHVRSFATRSEDEMLALGKRYGMGLQLINVLRDAGADLRAGRCYFPEEELAAAHLAASQILSEPDRFAPIYCAWLEKATAALECGMQYSRAIENRRVRAATALPALIGARTLALLHQAGTGALNRTVKMPRHEVRRMMLSLAMTFGSRKVIERVFDRARL